MNFCCTILFFAQALASQRSAAEKALDEARLKALKELEVRHVFGDSGHGFINECVCVCVCVYICVCE